MIGAQLLAAVIGSVERNTFEIAVDQLEGELHRDFDSLRFLVRGLGVMMIAIADDPDGLSALLANGSSLTDSSELAVTDLSVIEGSAVYGDLLQARRGEASMVLPLRPAFDRSLLEVVPTLAGEDGVTEAVMSGPIGDGSLRYVMLLPLGREGGAAIGSVLDVGLFIEQAIEESGDGYLAVSVTDVTNQPPITVVAMSAEPSRLSDVRTVYVLGRSWLVETHPGPAYPTSGVAPARWTTLAFGIVVSALLWILGVVDRRRRESQEERIALAEELVRSKDRFVASVSHELRTPLTAVHGFAAELVRMLQGVGSEISDMASTIAEQSDEMSHLIDDLLVAARAEVGAVNLAPKPVDLAEQIGSLVANLPTGKLVEITGSELPLVVYADPHRLRQILRNLISNAIRHGGDRIRVQLAGGAVATIRVTDNGPGVPDGEHDRIFLPYHQLGSSATQPASVGLGLTVARDLALRMAGELTYRRESGWSVFELQLPLAEPHREAVTS